MMVSAENDPRRTGTIWMMNLEEEKPQIQPRIVTTFRRIGLEILPALEIEPSIAELWHQRLERGRHCYTAWIEDRMVCYGWVSFEEEHIGELNLRVKLLPGESYIWDCATLAEFRRNRLYSSLLSFMLGQLKKDGFYRAWIGADMENLPSQQGMTLAGFHHVADLVIERVLAMRQVWVQGLPGVPEPIVAEARRAFLNDRENVWKKAATLGA